MDLKKLIADVKRDGKISLDEIAMMIADAFENGDSIEDVYKRIYEKAYGKTLNKTLAEYWVRGMDVTDNSARTTGEKWTIEQTTEEGAKASVDWAKFNKYDWYAVMNAAYSDFYGTAKKFGHEEDPMFFAMLAKDFWIKDMDVKGKTPFNYYFEYVA